MMRDNGRNRDVFLIFDIDWASDEVLEYAVSQVERYDIAATFFATHDTPLLRRLRENPKIELGIHPNFGPLFERNSERTASEITAACMAIVPEAVCVRTHALVAGSRLSALYRGMGLRLESSTYYHATEGVVPAPYVDTSGMTHVFHFWEDDVHCQYTRSGVEPDWSAQRFLDCSGVRVFDFHPIHIALNTSDFAQYEATRRIHRDLNAILALRKRSASDQEGAETFFHEMVDRAKSSGLQFQTMSSLLPSG